MNFEKINNSDIDVLTALSQRRSVRKYTGEPITETELNTILNAGFCAPSAYNNRPWDFIVVRNPASLQTIADANKYMKMLPSAGCAVVVCGNEEITDERDFLINDCSAAVQNMLLAAHGLNLGSLWCGIGNSENFAFFKEFLNLPAHIHPAALVVLGHAAEESPAPERFEAEHVHQEKF